MIPTAVKIMMLVLSLSYYLMLLRMILVMLRFTVSKRDLRVVRKEVKDGSS